MQTFVEAKSSSPLWWGFMSFRYHWNPKAQRCCAKSSTHPLPGCQNPPHAGPRSPATLSKSSEMQIFHTLSARFPQKASVRPLSLLTACPPTHLQTGCSWGLRRTVLGGRPPPPRGSLLWGAGTSASTLLFVYQFLANEPFPSQKKSYPEW